MTDEYLSQQQISHIVEESLSDSYFDNKRILLIIPDSTRTCPVDVMFKSICKTFVKRGIKLKVLIALGTHEPMGQHEIERHLKINMSDYCDVSFYNHEFKNPEQLISVGYLSEDDICDLSDGLFSMNVDIKVNRLIYECDHILICGPVFPHEVAGFSGGNKYLFPGISGWEIIDFFHWLGAVILQRNIIGIKDNPVRRVIDMAAKLIHVPITAFTLVVKKEGTCGIFYGNINDAWNRACDMSSLKHIVYKNKRYKLALSCAMPIYKELWTGGKCMYKLEPVMAENSKLIIYAPHIDHISVTHGAVLEEIGYHIRDYFLENWDRYKDYPWGVLAHSTHVKGMGVYKDCVERPNTEVILATSIAKETCEKINLGYMDYRDINPLDYANREDEGVLYVPDAGEILYRLTDKKESCL